MEIMEHTAKQAEFHVCSSMDEVQEYLSAADGMIIDLSSVDFKSVPHGALTKLMPVLGILPDGSLIREKREFRDLGFAMLLRSPVDEIDCDLFISRFCGSNPAEDVRLPGAGGGIAAVIDITALNNTQQKFRNRERELTSMINHVPGFFYRCADDEHWTMKFVSSGCRAVTGYAPDELIENRRVSFNSLIDTACRRNIRERWDRVIARGGLFEYEYPITTASGERRWVWERGWAVPDEDEGGIQLEGFITDISSRKDTEKSLRESEERYRSLVDTFPEGLILLDLDGRAVFANWQMADMLGFSSVSRMLGRFGYRSVFPPEIPAVRELWKELIRGSGKVSGRELSLRRAGGSVFPAEINAVVLRDQDGRPYRVMVVVRDITRRREAQFEHQLLTEQLFESRRMESVEKLAGGIAHDFNNMLGVIIGYIEQMLVENILDPRYTEFLTEMRAAANRSAELTRHLLACAGQQYSSPRQLSVNDAVEYHIGIFDRLSEEVSFRFHPGRKMKPVRMDPSQLDQILEHILRNALESVQDEGVIKVSTGTMSYNHVSTADAEHYVTISVQDTGGGISQEALKKVYEPYFTTKDSGTGLGLPIVYGIVRQNGGVINITSTPGTGTLVEVCLPSVPSGAEL